MKPTLFVLAFVLFPLLSFAQNGGVSFGVSGGDGHTPAPAPSGSNTKTTTTTSMGMSFDNSDNQPQPAPCKTPMDASSFKAAKETVAKAGFEDTKRSAAKSILADNCISTDQVIQVCKLFGFEQTKLDFAKLAYSKTTDRANYAKVKSVFTYATSKTNLDGFISNGGK